MTPKTKERFVLTWRIVTIALLSFSSIMVSVAVWFLVQIYSQIQHSYKAVVAQEQINKYESEHRVNTMVRMDKFEARLTEQENAEDKISERLYSVEAIVKYQRPQTFLNQN